MSRPAATDYPSLNGRVILVTGGSRGLGREMALELAASGAIVTITGTKESDELRNCVAELEKLAGPKRALGIVANVRANDECEAAVARVLETFGSLQVLINNAGLGMGHINPNFLIDDPKIWEIDATQWSDIVDTNLNGVFRMTKAAVRPMMAAGFGKIVNISTSKATMIRPGRSPYGPTKAAIEAASTMWSQELAGSGIDVNLYLPGGAVDTDMIPMAGRSSTSTAQILPASVMRRGIKWLCADQSNGRIGGRYIARLWDESLPPDEAAEKASELIF